jgi:hypothetical protein
MNYRGQSFNVVAIINVCVESYMKDINTSFGKDEEFSE